MSYKKEKILLVDDNPINIKVLSECLSGLDYELLLANNGTRCLAIASRAIPDLILLDINLPDLNGFEVCEKLKKNPLLASIPVIFLSALDDTQSKVDGFAVGAIDYVTKPFQKEEIIARVSTHLQIHKLTQALKQKNQEIHESIDYGARIQQAILPEAHTLKDLFPKSFMLYQPLQSISGDFYWWYKNGDDVFLVIGDCTGHGVPGGFMSLIGLHSVAKLVEDRNIIGPSQFMNKLDEEVQAQLNQDKPNCKTKDGMELIFCRFNFNQMSLHYASAKRRILLIRNRELIPLDYDKYPIGGGNLYASKPSFQSHFLSLKPNDVFYFYTDGLVDQFGGPKNRRFTTDRLKQTILELQNRPLELQKIALQEIFHGWQGDEEQTDDRTLIGIEIA